MDSLDKAKALIDQTQQQLVNSTGQGANPLQVLLAGALPMVRASLDELVDEHGSLDTFCAFAIAAVASLRSDGAPPLFVAPGGNGRPWIHLAIDPTRTGELAAPGAVAGIGQPVGIPDLPDWAFGVRQVDAGDVAADPDPGAPGDSRPDGISGH
jgi:hypothetical protein